MRRKIVDLSKEERAQLDEKILHDLVSRSSTLCYFFAFAFIVYAFTSLEIIRSYDPQLTLWNNFWPRLLLNCIPFLLLGRWFQKHKKSSQLKAVIAMIAMPVIFISACFIHAWPIMWHGGGSLYTYVHGANIYIITMTLIITSPPPKLLFLEIATFLVGFLVPLAYILSNWKENPLQ